MAEKKKSKINIALLAAAILLVLGAIIYSFAIQNQYRASGEVKIIQIRAPVYKTVFQGSNTAVLKLPAVNANNTGVSAYLAVSAKKGSGGVFSDIDRVLSKEDTQHSERMAAEFAKEHENISSGSVDMFYSIRAFAPVIEGPSAGAAFAVAAIAALRNETPASDVMITGALNHDGTIGPSGKIMEKARAAKEAGAKLFLVPLGSIPSLEANYTESDYCRLWGDYEYCYPELIPKIINVSEDAKIPIVEVATVDDALKYFKV